MVRAPPLPNSHRHDTGTPTDVGAERRTWIVIAVTLVMMVVEVGAGILFGSMALLADGWHMGSHAAALGITAGALVVARRFRDDPRFSFGTGKVGVLGGYTSAVVLAVIALGVVWASIERLLAPRAIAFDEALAVAALGLVVNLASAWLLRGHPAEHSHPHDHALRAAYLHVLADALTSLLAILALTAGKLLAWGFFDPLMGLIGGGLILRWSWGLLRDTAWILLDGRADAALMEQVRQRIEGLGAVTVRDLHLWRLSGRHLGLIVAVDVDGACGRAQIHEVLRDVPGLTHVTIEIRARAAGA